MATSSTSLGNCSKVIVKLNPSFPFSHLSLILLVTHKPLNSLSIHILSLILLVTHKPLNSLSIHILTPTSKIFNKKRWRVKSLQESRYSIIRVCVT
ncbi:hypothetical protein E1A91_A08G030000v1 [Gossypium mustelinum]|uniref:Uncharacterized protein n=1 Tax=Gossypium mustelinum TaxID=34275 RepID=A0A5D2Y4D6_GOSMU|nr:hypothetical protein E1A91_A08G030000v1 [Gossypium mustelinum]